MATCGRYGRTAAVHNDLVRGASSAFAVANLPKFRLASRCAFPLDLKQI